MGQAEFEQLLLFFKALGDESRLKIMGILANRECNVEELAALLGLREPTVSHHLNKLKALNLVGMRAEGNTHFYWLDTATLRNLKLDILTPERMATLVEAPEGEAWEHKVLRDFLVEGQRLKEIPASRKKRQVILQWLVSKFEPATRYPEAQVNEVIKQHHPDFATLRREFIMNKLMARENGVYWRLT